MNLQDWGKKNPTRMELAQKAFKIVARIMRLNGRRVDRTLAELRMKLHTMPGQVNASMRAPMQSRRARRRRSKALKMTFRPVYFYHGIEAKDHDVAIASLKCKDHNKALDWAERKAAA